MGSSNCLATKNSDLALEWDYGKNGDLTPYDVTPNSHKYVWWKCSNNSKHEWYAEIKSRNEGNGCSFCSRFYASEDYNLLVSNPKLANDWNYKKNENKPEDYTPNSGEKVWWICKECGHEWPARIVDRSKGRSCPYVLNLKEKNN